MQELKPMALKAVIEHRQAKQNSQRQNPLGAGLQAFRAQSQAAQRVAMQSVADEDKRPKRNPQRRVGVLPPPDVEENSAEDQCHFAGRGGGYPPTVSAAHFRRSE